MSVDIDKIHAVSGSSGRFFGLLFFRFPFPEDSLFRLADLGDQLLKPLVVCRLEELRKLFFLLGSSLPLLYPLTVLQSILQAEAIEAVSAG